MQRRNFMGKAGCGMMGLALGAPLLRQQQEKPATPPRYKIEIEIFEARPDSWCHKKGDKFAYPEDMGKICPWLLGSMHDFLILLQGGHPALEVREHPLREGARCRGCDHRVCSLPRPHLQPGGQDHPHPGEVTG